MGAVYLGTNRGALSRAHNFVEPEGSNDHVKFVNFIPAHEIAQIYWATVTLVMTSNFWATNI